MRPRRILVAGVGNVLRGDDGFGIEAARRLQASAELPNGVQVIETGIGGISLVQELMDEWDALVILDAVQGDEKPGALQLKRLEVADLRQSPPEEMRASLADIHYANPARALMLAKALDRLPRQVYLLGCQASSADTFGTTLSPPVREAAEQAVALLQSWLREWREPEETE